MRFYQLLNFQHVIVFVFPTLVFIIIFGLFLASSHWHTRRSELRKSKIIYRYPAGIEDKNAPVPLAMTLVFWATLVWAFCYILISGLAGVKI